MSDYGRIGSQSGPLDPFFFGHGSEAAPSPVRSIAITPEVLAEDARQRAAREAAVTVDWKRPQPEGTVFQPVRRQPKPKLQVLQALQAPRRSAAAKPKILSRTAADRGEGALARDTGDASTGGPRDAAVHLKGAFHHDHPRRSFDP